MTMPSTNYGYEPFGKFIKLKLNLCQHLFSALERLDFAPNCMQCHAQLPYDIITF